MRREQPRYGGGGGRGRKQVDLENVEKFNFERAIKLRDSFGRKGNGPAQLRAFQVHQRAARGREGNRELMAARSRGEIEGSERTGITRAGRKRGVGYEDVQRELFARSDTGRAGRPNPWVRKSNKRKVERTAVGKAARYYDPEEARQRRFGAGQATTGILGAALLAGGGRRARKLTRGLRSAPTLTNSGGKGIPLHSNVVDAVNTVRGGKFAAADYKALALMGGGVASGAASAGIGHRARSERNRRWS